MDKEIHSLFQRGDSSRDAAVRLARKYAHRPQLWGELGRSARALEEWAHGRDTALFIWAGNLAATLAVVMPEDEEFW